MRIKAVLLFTILFVFSAMCGLSDIIIVYKSGECSVDISGDGRWIAAELGMVLQSQSVVRTGQNGMIELDLDGELISIGSNRQASIHDLGGRIKQRKKVAWLSGLKKYAKSIASGSGTRTETALAGVRGATSEEDELEWFDETDFDTAMEERYNRGSKHFDDEKYTAAIEVFSNLIEQYGIGVLDGSAAFKLGISLFNVMRFEEAIPYLKESINYRDRDFYNVAFIHLAVSHYFIKNYSEAIRGLTLYAEEMGEDLLQPYALLMLGKCHKELGESDKAALYFRKVKTDYRNAELQQTAVEELAELENY